MTNTPTRLPPSNKAQALARDWLDQRREASGQSRAERADLSQALIQGLAQSLGDLGIQAVSVGDEVFSLKDHPPQPPSVSSPWSDHLAGGGEIFVLEVSNARCGYLDAEKVRSSAQTLDDLIDASLVHSLAPNAVIYAPGQPAPWERYLCKGAFQVWLPDAGALAAVWARLPDWVRTDWHDQAMAGTRLPRTFVSVASIFLARIKAPDMDWRVSQAARAAAQLEQAQALGEHDQLAQAALKRAMGDLLVLEEHPLLGAQASQWLEDMIPALGHAMEGKRRLKALEAAHKKADLHVRRALSYHQVAFRDWTPVPPAL